MMFVSLVILFLAVIIPLMMIGLELIKARSELRIMRRHLDEQEEKVVRIMKQLCERMQKVQEMVDGNRDVKATDRERPQRRWNRPSREFIRGYGDHTM